MGTKEDAYMMITSCLHYVKAKVSVSKLFKQLARCVMCSACLSLEEHAMNFNSKEGYELSNHCIGSSASWSAAVKRAYAVQGCTYQNV